MPKTALLFAGQGAQTVGMGQDLAATFPTARALFDRANQTLGYDLARICFGGPEAELTKTEHAQPAIYLVGWIALRLLQEKAPSFAFEATAGLSLGEFTALAAANVFSFEDGLKLVRARGQFMQEACETTRGSMAALIGIDEATTRAVCQESGAEIANLNCPGQIVISGSVESIAEACKLAQTRGAKRALPLNVAGAYHSRLMAPAQPKLRAALESLKLAQPAVTVLSNVTAQPHQESIGQALVDQVISPVRWEDSVRGLLAQGFDRFIELGPGTALSGFMKRIDKSAQMLNVADTITLEQTVKAVQGG